MIIYIINVFLFFKKEIFNIFLVFSLEILIFLIDEEKKQKYVD